MHVVKLAESQRAAVGGNIRRLIGRGQKQLVHRGVVVDERIAAFSIRGQHGNLDGGAQLVDIAKRPGLPGQIQRPGLIIKERAQRGGELLARGLVQLVEAHALAIGARDLCARAAGVEEQQVEQDGGNRADGHARRDEGLRPLREGSGNLRLEGHQHGQAQGGGDDDGVAAIAEIRLCDGLQAHPRHVGKKRERCAAEHRRRNRGNHRAGLRQQAQHDHEPRSRYGHPARFHIGQAHQAHVLRKAGIGEGIHDAAH